MSTKGRDPAWRSAYVEHDPVDFEPVGESMTRQEFREECDINTLMKRYQNTGAIPSHLNNAPPRYLDLTDTPDLMTALNTMHEAERAFMTLPSNVRREFDNDPVKFVEFASEAENLPRMREWGLAAPEAPVQAPIKVEVLNPAPAVDGAPKAP